MTMFDDDDDELRRWRGEWQAMPSSGGLAERVAKDSARMRRSAVTEVVAAVFSTFICLAMISRSRGALVPSSMCGVVLVFNGVWLARFFGERAGLFRASAASTTDFIELTR